MNGDFKLALKLVCTLSAPKRKTVRQLEAERDRQKRDLAAWQDKSGNALRSAP